ncbi:MAG: hypothetical protein WAW37_00970 [Syntrophobacteraceae bacterium]
MKKIVFILMTAILLAGGAVATMSAPSYAQVDEYPPPPEDPSASPWVGPDTPWVYYNGDWFLNGILYYFYGPSYGWGPYYAYAPSYIVRSHTWYAPRWRVWYQGQPQYYEHFQRQYPYWREHREGHRYNQKFYEQHHRDHGGGWHKGSHGGPASERRKQMKQRERQPQERKQMKQREQQPQEHKQQQGGDKERQ